MTDIATTELAQLINAELPGSEPKFEHFKISHEKGVLYFSHVLRGDASYNINTNEFVWGLKGNSCAKTYFKGYRFATQKYDKYHDRRIIINDDFGKMTDKLFANFLTNMVFPGISRHLECHKRSPAFALEQIKKFEHNLNWEKIGIKAYGLMSFGAEHVQKDIVRILVDTKFTLNDRIFEGDIKLFEEIIRYLQLEKIPASIPTNYGGTENQWERVIDNISHFKRLVTNGYKVEDIIRYLFNYVTIYEGLSVKVALEQLDDYANMQVTMGVTEFKKYPKYLRSNHDIIVAEYNRHKHIYDEIKFATKINQQLAFENNEFVIVVPSKPQDVKDEGKQLSHCVGSYIERIMAGQTQILFLRLKENPLKSVVTVEVRDNVLIQAKGFANRGVTKEEIKMIEHYAREKKLLVRI